MSRLRHLALLSLLPVAVGMGVGWWYGNNVAPASGGAVSSSQPADAHAPGEKKSHSGKVLTKAPELPVVTVGGQRIITGNMLFEQQLQAATPESLQGDDVRRLMQSRIKISPFSHSPSLGPDTALLSIVEMTDLSCVQCMATLQKIDAAMAENPALIRLVHIHNPVKQFNAVNMAAFYGKVAARGGKFWEYRKALETLANPTPEAYFETLMAIGMERSEVRRLMQTDARRFYRELDADARMGQQLNLSNPPHIMVNGIHVGTNGVPLEELPHVIQYELKRPRPAAAEEMP